MVVRPSKIGEEVIYPPGTAKCGSAGLATIPSPEADNATIQVHLEKAKALREREAYANALRELDKANAISPDNQAIGAEV